MLYREKSGNPVPAGLILLSKLQALDEMCTAYKNRNIFFDALTIKMFFN
jgi:hypothetical protein